ncbi:hypothetical protein [Microcoleus sp. herbarium14]|uniref:hypothetical protein n=1 Tax=Microcoleus sp. herbarium14 TaxID=3055439 RepID=UPI002FD710A3
MSQFDYLRNQISDNIWAGKEILKIADTVNEGIQGGKDWYMNLPQIKFIMESEQTEGIRDILTEAKELSETVTDSSLLFLETVHGINRAFNTQRHRNFTVKINNELAKLVDNDNEKAVYEASVMAHNETLNLPELSKQAIAYSDAANSTASEVEKWKNEAIEKALEKKAEFEAMLETLKGNARRSIQGKLNMVEKALTGMGRPSPPKPPKPPKTPKTPKAPPVIIASNPYSMTSYRPASYDSIYKHSIVSIHSRPPVLNAIIPIGPGGAVTVAGAISIVTSIASWLLGSFFLKALSIPPALLVALTNTVTAIVLKNVGSAGTLAARYIAAQALEIGKDLLPKIFAFTGMRISGWAYVMSFAAPIIAAAVIIITAMKHKNKIIFSHFYLLAEHDKYPGFAYASIQNADDARIEFATMKEDLLALANVEYEEIYGVGIDVEDGKPEVQGGFNLTTDTPKKMNTTEAKKALEDFAEKHSVSIPLGAWKPV